LTNKHHDDLKKEYEKLEESKNDLVLAN